MISQMRDPVTREFLLTFWKIHILHHAGEEGVYGQWMLEELARHGYQLSPGTIYPVLTRMAERGWLRVTPGPTSKSRRVYHLTPKGRAILTRVRHALDELYGEVGEHDRRAHSRKRAARKPRSTDD